VSQELIYTSAPQGLKPGSRGFCTVAATQGMAPNLTDRLESLSGYRHIYAPQDAQARLNPVAYSHVRLTVGPRRYHVLSRIADAGLDYSQRTNKLAHHVVLEVAELVPAGPAALLGVPGFLETRWNNEVRVLPAGRRVPAIASRPAVCTAWQRQTGDAGWGGVMAETAVEKAHRTVYVIFRPGMDLLPLLAEALAMVPGDVRWEVSFSTYFTRMPAGVDCQWRCVVEGSLEAAAIVRSTQTLVIDLTRPLGQAPGSPYVEAARTGAVPARPAPVPGATLADDRQLAQWLRTPIGPSPEEPLAVAAPSGRGPMPPPLSPSAVPSHVRMGLSPKRWRTWPWIALGGAVVLLIASATAAVWMASRGESEDEELLLAMLEEESRVSESNVVPDNTTTDTPKPDAAIPEGDTATNSTTEPALQPAASAAGPTNPEATASPAASVTTDTAAEAGKKDLHDRTPAAAPVDKASLPATDFKPSAATPPSMSTDGPGRSKTAPEAAKKPGAELDALPSCLSIPSSSRWKGRVPQSVCDGNFLKAIRNADCSLVGGAEVFGGGRQCNVRVEHKSDSIDCRFELAAGRSPLEIGVLQFSARGISFIWNNTSTPAEQLVNCILVFTKDGHRREIQLREPMPAVSKITVLGLFTSIKKGVSEPLPALNPLPARYPLYIEILAPKGFARRPPASQKAEIDEIRLDLFDISFLLSLVPSGKSQASVHAQYLGLKAPNMGFSGSANKWGLWQVTPENVVVRGEEVKEDLKKAKQKVNRAQKAIDTATPDDKEAKEDALKVAKSELDQVVLQMADMTNLDSSMKRLSQTRLPYRVYFTLKSSDQKEPPRKVILFEARENDLSTEGQKTRDDREPQP